MQGTVHAGISDRNAGNGPVLLMSAVPEGEENVPDDAGEKAEGQTAPDARHGRRFKGRRI